MTAFGPNKPGAAGAPGNDGDDGAPGADGRDAGIRYTFESSTSTADPGSGKLSFNHATPSSVTHVYISETDADGAGIAALLARLSASTNTTKATLLIRERGTPANFVSFTVASQTDNGAWRTLGVAHVASSGTFSDDDSLSFEFALTGDVGAAGSNGSNGTNGRDAGWRYQWNTSTSNADPGSGKISINNASFASGTVLRINETSNDSNAIANVLALWDDGVNDSSTRGYVTLIEPGTPGNFVVYRITGALTDAGSYVTFPVASVASNGSFANNDDITIAFTPAGPREALSPLGLQITTTLDDAGDSGWYWVTSWSSNGLPSGDYMVHTMAYNANNAYQFAILRTAPHRKYERTKVAGTWGTFRQIEPYARTEITTTATLTYVDREVECSAGTYTVTLPDRSTVQEGYDVTITLNSAGVVTIARNSSELIIDPEIDTASNTIVLYLAGDTVTLRLERAGTGGTQSGNWYVVSKNIGTHHCVGVRAAAQGIAGGGGTVAITLDANAAARGLTVASGTIAILRPGDYRMHASWGLGGLAAGVVTSLQITVNGGAVAIDQRVTTATLNTVYCHATFAGTLSAGQTIGMLVTQNSGGALNTNTGVTARPTLIVEEMR